MVNICVLTFCESTNITGSIVDNGKIAFNLMLLLLLGISSLIGTIFNIFVISFVKHKNGIPIGNDNKIKIISIIYIILILIKQ